MYSILCFWTLKLQKLCELWCFGVLCFTSCLKNWCFQTVVLLFFKNEIDKQQIEMIQRCTKHLSLFSHQVVSDSLRPRGLQHTRLLCPSPSPRVCPSSCPLNQWCHPTISSSLTLFFCLLSFPASGSFPVSQLFTSGGQSIGASLSVSVLPENIQDWFPLGFSGYISL